jgi:hypothetical protein
MKIIKIHAHFRAYIAFLGAKNGIIEGHFFPRGWSPGTLLHETYSITLFFSAKKAI